MPRPHLSSRPREVTSERDNSYSYSSGQLQPLHEEITTKLQKKGRIKGEPHNPLSPIDHSPTTINSAFPRAAIITTSISQTIGGDGVARERVVGQESARMEGNTRDGPDTARGSVKEGRTNESNNSSWTGTLSEPHKGDDSANGYTGSRVTETPYTVTLKRTTTAAVRVITEVSPSTVTGYGHSRFPANSSIEMVVTTTSTNTTCTAPTNTSSTSSGVGSSTGGIAATASLKDTPSLPIASISSGAPPASSGSVGTTLSVLPGVDPQKGTSSPNSASCVDGIGEKAGQANHSISPMKPSSPKAKGVERTHHHHRIPASDHGTGCSTKEGAFSFPSSCAASVLTMHSSSFPVGNDGPITLGGTASNSVVCANKREMGCGSRAEVKNTNSNSLHDPPPGATTKDPSERSSPPGGEEEKESLHEHRNTKETITPPTETLPPPFPSPPLPCEHHATLLPTLQPSSSISSECRPANATPPVEGEDVVGSTPASLLNVTNPSPLPNTSMSSCSTTARSGLVERRAKFDIGSLVTLSMDNLHEELHSPALRTASPVASFRGWCKLSPSSERCTPHAPPPLPGLRSERIPHTSVASAPLSLDLADAMCPSTSLRREGPEARLGHGLLSTTDSGGRSSGASTQSGSSHLHVSQDSRGGTTPCRNRVPPRTLKVVSYNILAQRFVSTDDYPTCPPSALTEEHRLPLIMEELRQAEADIIALSEMSVRAFAGEPPLSVGHFLHHTLNYDGYHVANTLADGKEIYQAKPYFSSGSHEKKHGNIIQFGMLDTGGSFLTPSMPSDTASSSGDNYSCSFSPRSKATSKSNGGDVSSSTQDMDGVAIFFSNQRFDVLEVHPVYFNRIGAADPLLTSAEKKALLVKSHNVGLVLVLRDLWNPSWVFVVGTSHLIWRSEGQLWQLHQLIKVMEKLKLQYQQKVSTPHTCPPPCVLSTGSSSNSGFHPTTATTTTTAPAVDATRSAAGASSFMESEGVELLSNCSPPVGLHRRLTSPIPVAPLSQPTTESSMAAEEKEPKCVLGEKIPLPEGGMASPTGVRSTRSFRRKATGEYLSNTMPHFNGHPMGNMEAGEGFLSVMEVTEGPVGGAASHHDSKGMPATASTHSVAGHRPLGEERMRANSSRPASSRTSGTSGSAGARRGELDGSTSLSPTSNSMTMATPYHVACILAGDFNMEPHHPALDYACTGMLRSDAEVCKAWRETSSTPSVQQGNTTPGCAKSMTPVWTPAMAASSPPSSVISGMCSTPVSPQKSPPFSLASRGASTTSVGVPTSLFTGTPFHTCTTTSASTAGNIPNASSPPPPPSSSAPAVPSRPARTLGESASPALPLQPSLASFSSVEVMNCASPAVAVNTSGSNDATKGVLLHSYSHTPHQAIPPPLPLPSHPYRSLHLKRPSPLSCRTALLGVTPRGNPSVPVSPTVPLPQSSSGAGFWESGRQNSQRNMSIGESSGGSSSSYSLFSSTLSHANGTNNPITPFNILTPPSTTSTSSGPSTSNSAGRGMAANSNGNSVGNSRIGATTLAPSGMNGAPRFHGLLLGGNVSSTSGAMSETPSNEDGHEKKKTTIVGEEGEMESSCRVSNTLECVRTVSEACLPGAAGNSSGGRGGGGWGCLTPLSPPLAGIHRGANSVSSSVGVSSRTTSPRSGFHPLYSPLSFTMPGCYASPTLKGPTPTPPHPLLPEEPPPLRNVQFHWCTSSKSEGEQPGLVLQTRLPYEYSRSGRVLTLYGEPERKCNERKRGARKHMMVHDSFATKTAPVGGGLSGRSTDGPGNRLAMTARGMGEKSASTELQFSLENNDNRVGFRRQEKLRRTQCLTPPHLIDKGGYTANASAGALPPPVSSFALVPQEEDVSQFKTNGSTHTTVKYSGEILKTDSSTSSSKTSYSSEGFMLGIVMKGTLSSNSPLGSVNGMGGRHEGEIAMMSYSIDGAGETRAGREDLGPCTVSGMFLNRHTSGTVEHPNTSTNTMKCHAVRSSHEDIKNEGYADMDGGKHNSMIESISEGTESDLSSIPPPPYHSGSLPTASVLEAGLTTSENVSPTQLADPFSLHDGFSGKDKKTAHWLPSEEKGGEGLECMASLLPVPVGTLPTRGEEETNSEVFPPLASCGVGSKERVEVRSAHVGEPPAALTEGKSNHTSNPNQTMPSLPSSPPLASSTSFRGGRGAGTGRTAVVDSGKEKNSVLPELTREERSGRPLNSPPLPPSAMTVGSRSTRMTALTGSPGRDAAPSLIFPPCVPTSSPRTSSPPLRSNDALGTGCFQASPSSSLLDSKESTQRGPQKGKKDTPKEESEGRPSPPWERGKEEEDNAMFMDCASPRPRKRNKNTIQAYAAMTPSEGVEEDGRNALNATSTPLGEVPWESSSPFLGCPSSPRKKKWQPVPPSVPPAGSGGGRGGVGVTSTIRSSAEGLGGINGIKRERESSTPLSCDSTFLGASSVQVFTGGPNTALGSDPSNGKRRTPPPPSGPLPLSLQMNTSPIRPLSPLPPPSPETASIVQDALRETQSGATPTLCSGSCYPSPGRTIFRLQPNRMSLSQHSRHESDGHPTPSHTGGGTSRKSISSLSLVSNGPHALQPMTITTSTSSRSPLAHPTSSTSTTAYPHPVANHQLRFRNVYEAYLAKHPNRVTSNSGVNEGKVIDYILCDPTDLLKPDSVLQLGEKTPPFPSWNCPSDHVMVGAVFTLQSPVARVRSSLSSKTSVSSCPG